MEVALPLDQMTTVEKLRVMETIWADLSRHEEEIDSPAWHEKVLREREERLASGAERYVDWTTAKTEILRRTI